MANNADMKSVAAGNCQLHALLALLALVGCCEACNSNLNCSLNGLCVNGACVCDAAWRGPSCAALALLPTGPTGDLRIENTSTWGMTVFPMRQTGFNNSIGTGRANVSSGSSGSDEWQWHGLFAEMGNHCGLTSWETNSFISHATAPSPGGPWSRQDTVLGVWSHTPSAVVAPDGTIVLFHIGAANTPDGALPGSREYNANCSGGRSPCGTHPWHHCNASAAPVPQAGALPTSTAAARRVHSQVQQNVSSSALGVGGVGVGVGVVVGGGAGAGATTTAGTVSFHVAASPSGPWRMMTAQITDSRGVAARAAVAAHGTGATPNFAFDTPFAHRNGTIYVITADRIILRADTWRGPYDAIASHACGDGEDNYLYIDGRDNFHCLYHRSPFPDLSAQGGHAYSEDGYVWHVSSTPAYGASQQYTDGSVGTYGKRERPHLVFDPVTGEPTHLTNGVCLHHDWAQCNNNPWPGYYDYTFTTVAPLQTSRL